MSTEIATTPINVVMATLCVYISTGDVYLSIATFNILTILAE